MATVTLNEMKDKLLSLNDVYTVLDRTEPVASANIDNTTKIKFKMDPDWAMSIDALDGIEPVGVYMTVGGKESQLTKDAALQAGANFGIPGAYAKKVPAVFIERLLNYHYGNGMGSSEFSVLSVNDRVSAFTKPNLTTFSNRQLLDSVVRGVHDQLGKDTPIFGDYKIMNRLSQTDVRLILPMASRVMDDTNMHDVPDHGEDVWFAGLHLANSMIAKSQTAVEAYMFRWWCTNGATTTLEDVGVWNRRVNGQDEEDVYAWAQMAVDDVLGGMEARFDSVQALSRLNVSGNTSDILSEIFSTYGVPVSQRAEIMDTLLESETLTLYSIMSAITQTANDPEIDPRRADRMMRIGGALPTTTFDPLKAKIWEEGHKAEPESVNPYVVAPVQ